MLLLAVIVGCSGGGSKPPIKLDGSPRHASDQGVVTMADRHAVVLDGARHYPVGSRLLVFLPDTLAVTPLASALGRYALIGTAKGQVIWIEPLSVVLDEPGLPKTVFYQGTLSAVTNGTGVFGDGTVLDFDPGVTAPPSLPRPVRADIDPDSHRVRELTPG